LGLETELEAALLSQNPIQNFEFRWTNPRQNNDFRPK